MKNSRYNTVHSLANGKELFFNFYTLGLLALDSKEAAAARRILKQPGRVHRKGAKGRLTQLLIENGFLIDSDIDELALLEQAYRTSRSDDSSLGLTILPTLACNFRCTYCYEDSQNAQHMSREVEAALVAFVEKRLKKAGHLTVTWFGGEPLLRMETIESLSHAFLDICQDRDVKYEASIITNGFLLDEKAASRLKDLNVKSAQLTLDGPPEIHDKRRPLRRGGGTFQTIVNNLQTAAEILDITVRINIDADNKDAIGPFLDLMIERGLGDKVGFYPGQTTAFTSTCGNIAGVCLGGEAFSLATLETSMELTSRGLPDSSYPAARVIPCGAVRKSSFVITPSGGIVTCWNHVAESEEYSAHLLKPATKKMERKRRDWAEYDPFNMECRECPVLPICMGGCPYLYLKQGRLACSGWKHHTPEHLLNYYRLKLIERESDIAQGFQVLVDALKKKEKS